MNKPFEAYINCPFYKSERGGKSVGQKRTPARITCEGYVPGTEVTMLFNSKNEQRKHIVDNCFSLDGGNCFLARCLFYKYEHPDEEGEII